MPTILPRKQVYLQRLVRALLKAKMPDTYLTNNGDGVVTVGGGKYWPGIAVSIAMLRQSGCNLPVEIWYRSSEEQVCWEDISRWAHPSLYGSVTLCDIDSYGLQKGWTKGIHAGWRSKLFALMNTTFSRVLFLDGDAYCVENPQPLFDLLNKHSFVYWRDLNSQMNSVKWEYVWPIGDMGVTPVQGGQLLIDREKAWKLIYTSDFMCRHSDYYFKYMYGDQDTWRVALAAGVCKDAYCLGKADWRGVAFVCEYDSEPYIVHRCQGKLFSPLDIPEDKHRYSNPQYYLPKEDEVFQNFANVLNRKNLKSAQVFDSIIRRGLWGPGVRCGSGSSEKEHSHFSKFVNDLLKAKGHSTLVDLGCGEYRDCYDVQHYIGVDCSPLVINRNKRKFPEKSWIGLDFLENSAIIPLGDCLVCKDVLHHWPNKNIIKLLEYLRKAKNEGKWKTIILCQDRNQRWYEQDTYLGGYRALSADMYPLCLFPEFKRAMEYMHKDVLVCE